MEFSRPEYCSGEPFPPPGDLPNPGIEPKSPALQADSLPAEPTETLLAVITPSHMTILCLDLLFLIFTVFIHWAASGLSCGCRILSHPVGCLAASHRLSAVLCRLSQCSTWAPRPSAPILSALGLSCSTARGIFVVWPGIEPMSPPLQGRFFTTGLPGKSRLNHLLLCPWTRVAFVGRF